LADAAVARTPLSARRARTFETRVNRSTGARTFGCVRRGVEPIVPNGVSSGIPLVGAPRIDRGKLDRQRAANAGGVTRRSRFRAADRCGEFGEPAGDAILGAYKGNRHPAGSGNFTPALGAAGVDREYSAVARP